jgi:ABC-type histidine transport system ATPase subunit
VPVLTASDIVQRFGSQEVLHGVSLGVEPGEGLGGVVSDLGVLWAFVAVLFVANVAALRKYRRI